MSKIIDVKGIHYKIVNETLQKAVAEENEIILTNVNGQRYIGAGIKGNQKVIIEGTPGNDLACYMDGLEVIVKGNGQDGICNTMNDGTVVIQGDVGDIAGYAMRGGELYVEGDVGYRVGIHMKEYKDKVPVIVVGGKAGDFFGEYMAGGTMIVLGLDLEPGEEIVGNYCGTGMHGGMMYIRGRVDPYKLGKEVKSVEMDAADHERIGNFVKRYCEYFDNDAEEILAQPFIKLIPYNKRPYGNLYCPH